VSSPFVEVFLSLQRGRLAILDLHVDMLEEVHARAH